jgi:hypothetical protein
MGRKLILVILSALLLCCVGCRTSADFNYIEKSIRDGIYPANLHTNFKFSIGSHSLGILNGFVDDKEEADAYIKEIKSVQVGIYKIRNSEKSGSFQIPNNVEQCMVEKGWERFVRVRNRKGENVLLFYRQISEDTASIYAIVLEPDELVIAEINGQLDNILEKAICDHRLAGMDRL